MRRLLTTVTLTCLAAAPAIRAQQVYAPDSTPPKFVDLRNAGPIPLASSGIRAAAVPVVEVMVDGRGPFRFGIETGAGFVAVSRAFADSLRLPRAGGPDEVPEFHVDSITLGGALFRDVNVSSLPRSASGVDGLLGLPFFHDVLLTIDYPGGRVLLSRDTLPTPNARGVFALGREGPFWTLPLTMAGHDFHAVLDTRSTGSLSTTPAIAATLPFEDSLRVIGRAGGAAIPTTEVKAGRLKGDVTLGQYTFPNPFITVRALPPAFPKGPLVGASVLQNFVVSLDQRTGRIRLEHAGPPTITLPGLGRP